MLSSKLLVLYLIISVQTEEESKNEDARIITTLNYSRFRVQTTSVRGRVVPKGHFSYLVSIKRSFQKVSESKHLWSTYCGGSIIHPTKVLTAAHCFDMKNFYYLTHFSLLRAVAGSTENHIEHQGFTADESGVQWRQITDVQLHYDFHFPANDIAIINVDIPFDFNRIISYYNAYQNNPDYEGTCFTAGFGQIGVVAKEKVSKVLLWAEIHLIAKERCTAIWGMNMDKFVCSDTIVTDISGGDAGGPLVCPLTHRKSLKTDDNRNFVLVGIASGKNSDKTRLYTRVSAYQNWIDEPTYRTSCARRVKYSVCLFLVHVWFIKFVCTCFDCIYFLSFYKYLTLLKKRNAFGNRVFK